MARANNHDNDLQLDYLTTQFGGQLDADIVESVFVACNYDFDLSRKSLADMLGINLDTATTTNSAKNEANAAENLNTSTITSQPSPASLASDLHLSVVDFAQKGYRILIFVRGLPGSGKSTLAKQLLDQIIGSCNPRDYIFSADDFFMSNGEYKYKPYLVPDAHAWCQKKAYQAIVNGISPIIIDNTNVQLRHMEPYARWGTENGYRVVIQEPNTAWRYKAGELARRNKHNVPKDKILDLLDTYERNVTVERLFQEFRLYYHPWQPPVMRTYPPVRNKQDLKQENVVTTKTPTSSSSKQWSAVSATRQDASVGTRDKNKGREVVPTENYVNNGHLPLKYPKHGCFDKGTMTEEESEDNKEVQQTLDYLQSMFETIPRYCLEDVLYKCKGDVEWCITILLDDPKQVLSNCEELQRPAKVVDAPSAESIVQVVQEEKGEPKIAKREENLELKKFIEGNVVINHEHYGPNASKMKGFAGCASTEQNGAGTSANGGARSHAANLEEFAYEDTDNDEDDSDDTDPHSTESQDDDTIELNLGAALVDQLNSLFGDPDLQLPRLSFAPVVEIPRRLAQQLHACYFESVFKQMENQDALHQQMLAEDEEMQMALQLEEIRRLEERRAPDLRQIMRDQAEAQRGQRFAESQWRNLTPADMAYKMTLRKLEASFPKVAAETLREMYAAHANDYEDTVASLRDSGLEFVDNARKTISSSTLAEMQAAHDASGEMEARERREFEQEDGRDRTSGELRQEAANHQRLRAELLSRAQAYCGRGMSEVATFYSDLASRQTRMWEKYNSMAAVQIVNEGFHRSDKADTIDLHYLRVQEALIALDIYVDEKIDQLRSSGKKNRDIFVITGRGKNSPNGIPRIRPSVEQRLKRRKLKCNRVNEGLLKVRIHKNAFVTAQFM